MLHGCCHGVYGDADQSAERQSVLARSPITRNFFLVHPRSRCLMHGFHRLWLLSNQTSSCSHLTAGHLHNHVSSTQPHLHTPWAPADWERLATPSCPCVTPPRRALGSGRVCTAGGCLRRGCPHPNPNSNQRSLTPPCSPNSLTPPAPEPRSQLSPLPFPPTKVSSNPLPFPPTQVCFKPRILPSNPDLLQNPPPRPATPLVTQHPACACEEAHSKCLSGWRVKE